MMSRSSHTSVLSAKFLPVALGASLLGSLPSPSRAAEPMRGDADGNGQIQLTDAVRILNVLFLGTGTIPCFDTADADNNGELQLTDAVRILNVLFLGTGSFPPLSQDEINACKGITPEAIARGMKEYEQPDPDGNVFSCALCHSMSPDSESEVIRSGHTLLNSLGRPSFKDGERDFVGAVNVCREDWMAVATEVTPNNFQFIPWTAAEPRFKDLVAFMTSLQTQDTSPAVPLTIVPPAKTGPSTGDALEGCKLFNRSCSVCHQKGGLGQAGVPPGEVSPGPSLVDVTDPCPEEPDLCLNLFCEPTATCLDSPDYIRYRIRLSGPDRPDSVYHVPPGFTLAGGTMPFWTADRLTDAQVEDLVAFVAAARQAAREGKTTLDCTEDPNPDGNVLRRGTLTTLHHSVAGVAEELDTRKIRFTSFFYDGGGILVKVWLFKSGNINGGTAIGPDIIGQIMRNTTFVVDIPAGIPSDAFDSVSIWCVSAKADFGSTQLQPVP